MKIVFLDINGVLQPYDKEYVIPNDENFIENLSKKYNIDYSIYNFYGVCHVYFDWDKDSLRRLKTILDETGAKIIMSSNWRSKKYPNKLKDYLTIHGLQDYYLDSTVFVDDKTSFAKRRASEISKTLEIYKPDKFLVLDDKSGLLEYFPNNTVITTNIITDKDVQSAIQILNGE